MLSETKLDLSIATFTDEIDSDFFQIRSFLSLRCDSSRTDYLSSLLHLVGLVPLYPPLARASNTWRDEDEDDVVSTTIKRSENSNNHDLLKRYIASVIHSSPTVQFILREG